MATKKQKKDHIINLRLSKATYSKLKERAKANSESLSDLVRTTLNDSLEIMGDISHDVFGTKKKTDKVMHYYEVILTEPVACAKCSVRIKKGTKALLGETQSGKKRYACIACPKKK